MSVRSILFVPGDSERKLERSADCPADAIVLDLEDSVSAYRKADARRFVRAALNAKVGRQQYWVRINAFDSGEALADLAAVAGGKPDVILLPKANGVADVERLDHYLTILETCEGLDAGTIKVAVVATETGAAMFGLGTYHPGTPRLVGLTWGAEDLAAAVGASSNADGHGRLTPLYEMARALCLAASAAAQVEAIDTAFINVKDLAGLTANSDAARRDGFRAKLAIHPDQVEIINRAFTPSGKEVEEARRIAAAFAQQPDAAAFLLDGRMIDMPHLKQAQRVLALHEQFASA